MTEQVEITQADADRLNKQAQDFVDVMIERGIGGGELPMVAAHVSGLVLHQLARDNEYSQRQLQTVVDIATNVLQTAAYQELPKVN